MRLSTTVLGCTLLALAACEKSSSKDPSKETAPPPLRLELVASNLAMPVELAVPPGDTQRLFIAEKGGTIAILENGALIPVPFLDISGLVSGGSEQGLLGLTFDPDYASNGRFYVYYTDGLGDSVLARYLVSAADPNLAEPAADEILLVVDQPEPNHNGGRLAFGPDGYLYVGLGDGGGAGDPTGTGQDTTDLLGSLLRLDVSGASGYAIPPDNPFAGDAVNRQEVFSYGLRNPWRFSFDRSTGDLYIGDVGQREREEIDLALVSRGAGSGFNFGWNITEGFTCYEPPSGCDAAGLVLPVLDYDHSDGCSVTGGFVYRGSALPSEFQGVYFYGDYCEGWIRSFRFDGTAATELTEWASLGPGEPITSFGEDDAGELYVLTAAGNVYRLMENVIPPQ
ncbi:MAG: PQQ-dependent sugar dehydrogenase [Planctomycetota bacterium]